MTGAGAIESKQKGDRLVPIFLASSLSALLVSLGAIGYPARCLRDSVGFDTLGTHANTLDLALYDRTDTLEVGVPAAITFIVSVAYMVAEPGAFATHVTYSSHDLSTAVGIGTFAKL